MRKILLTGGSGFIGTNIIEWLLSNNLDFINLDINKPKNIHHISFWNKVDITDYDNTSKIINQFKPTHILHLAADLGMDHKNLDELQCNIIGQENLVKIVKKVNSLKRIVFTSSLLVCKNGYIPQNNNDYCPPNFYGKSKVIGEKIVQSAKLNCEWAIVRPTSIWGPWFDYSYKKFFQTIDRNYFIHIGKNEFQKPAAFVGNAVHMYMKILFSKDENINHSIFYLADFPWYSTKAWANTIQKTLKTRPIKTAPLFLFKLLAFIGDIFKKIFQYDPPLTSFRLNNMLTGGNYPVDNTIKVVGQLPYDLKESVFITAKWMYKNKLIKHKPIIIK